NRKAGAAPRPGPLQLGPGRPRAGQGLLQHQRPAGRFPPARIAPGRVDGPRERPAHARHDAMTQWTRKAERGSAWLIHLIAWLARTVGRPACRLLLYPIVAYFVVTDPAARQASKEFLQRVRGRHSRLRDVFSHLYCFAATLLDRVYMAAGEFDRFELEIEGLALLEQAQEAGHGCVLLGSHLGSFDLLML